MRRRAYPVKFRTNLPGFILRLPKRDELPGVLNLPKCWQPVDRTTEVVSFADCHVALGVNIQLLEYRGDFIAKYASTSAMTVRTSDKRINRLIALQDFGEAQAEMAGSHVSAGSHCIWLLSSCFVQPAAFTMWKSN